MLHQVALGTSRNYLRVRGEYAPSAALTAFLAELPPRARRIPYRRNKISSTLGTTSACAENTLGRLAEWWLRWNYLRVRGEYPV